MNIFGFSYNKAKAEKLDPLEQSKQWTKDLMKESRKIDKDIQNLERAGKKAMLECKKLAKDGHMNSVKILAKEVVATRKAVERMHCAKAQLNSVKMSLSASVSMIKMQGCISKSTEIMTSMNQLMNIPELSETMKSMQREMERAGLVEEIFNETFDMIGDDGIEAEADAEVNKIMEEITAGILAPAGSVPITKKTVVVEEKVVEEESDDLEEMQRRLASL